MKDEKSQHWHGYNSQHNRTDNNGHCRVDIAAILAEKVDDQVDDGHDDRAHHSGQEEHEESIIPLPDAVIHKGAVMVEYFHAILAGGAVAGPTWTVDVAGRAELVVVAAAEQEELSSGWMEELEEGAARDDSGVSAGCEVEEDCGRYH